MYGYIISHRTITAVLKEAGEQEGLNKEGSNGSIGGAGSVVMASGAVSSGGMVKQVNGSSGALLGKADPRDPEVG